MNGHEVLLLIEAVKYYWLKIRCFIYKTVDALHKKD